MIIVVIGELCPNNILNIDLVRELSDEERRQIFFVMIPRKKY